MDQSNSAAYYPEINRDTTRLLQIQEEVQRISDQIYDLLQNAIDASSHCSESSFYQIAAQNDRAYRLSLNMSGLLMEAASLGSNLTHVVGRIKAERSEQKRGR